MEKKRSLQAAKVVEERRAAERKLQLAESQRQLREAIRAQAIIVDEPTDENHKPGGSTAYSSLGEPKASKSDKHASSGSGKGSGAGAGGTGKPAWARSTQAQDRMDEDEEEDLLGFVNSFNPDRYEEDLEVCTFASVLLLLSSSSFTFF
jgi:hypothetical protein